ncbi:MAG: hypothetical protein ACI4U1_01735, partial [Anaerovoracaceae bacterium]
MNRPLDEKNVSHGFRTSISAVAKVIPQCNVCIYWNGRGKCKIYGESPGIYISGKSYDCEKAILDKDYFLPQQFLYFLP